MRVVRVGAVDVVAVLAGVCWFVLPDSRGPFIHITHTSTHVSTCTQELIRLIHTLMRSYTNMHLYDCYLLRIGFICLTLTTVYGRQW